MQNVLDQFCQSKHLEMGKIKLAFEQPQEKQGKKLFNLVYKEKKDLFDFYELDQLNDFLEEAAQSGEYSKFSDLF